MNGYVIGGYLVVLISLGTYAVALVQRLRASKRRIDATLSDVEERSGDERSAAR
jgi:hypothetical protein